MDHWISPTWSPDGTRADRRLESRPHLGGRQLLEVARAAGRDAREIRDEETTWKGRPDWSRDGRRVVYSSYLGRQWNQLWLMTADGANPLQLTYGDWDATAPRWSPDGRRIAYVSNESGNTSLWIVEVPGGRRTSLRAERRIYRHPVGTLRLAVASPARVSVTGPDGRSFAPDDAWRHADDGFDRGERRFEYGYFHTSGAATLTLPTGRYDIEVTRGPAFRVGAPDGRDPGGPRLGARGRAPTA